MAQHDIVVFGASAGGVEALTRMVRDLPPGLPANLFVVCHFPRGRRSVLPNILRRSVPLLAKYARDGKPFRPGDITTLLRSAQFTAAQTGEGET